MHLDSLLAAYRSKAVTICFSLVFEISIFVIYCIAGYVINYLNVTICAVRT